MTTSQCSKSQPSSRIVSFGGRLDQLGLGSLREEDVALEEKHRTAEETLPRVTMAPARGRRRWRREREERDWSVEMEMEDEVEKEREKKEARVRVLGRERETKLVVMAEERT